MDSIHEFVAGMIWELGAFLKEGITSRIKFRESAPARIMKGGHALVFEIWKP